MFEDGGGSEMPGAARRPVVLGAFDILGGVELADLRSELDPAPGGEALRWAAFVAAESIDTSEPDEWTTLDGIARSAGVDAHGSNDAAGAGHGVASAAEHLAGLVPGRALVELVERVHLELLDADDVVEVAAAWHRVISWAAAGRASAVAELARRPETQPAPSAPSRRSVSRVTLAGDEISTAMALTSAQAENLAGLSVQVIEDFPDAHAAWADGRLDERRVRVIVDELTAHDRRVRDLVLAAVLPHVHGWDSAVLRRSIKAILHELAPESMAERRQRAAQGRYVKVTPAPDGMAYLEAHLPAEDAMAIKAMLDAAATTMRNQDRAARAHAGPSSATASNRSGDGAGGHDRAGGHRSPSEATPNVVSEPNPRSPLTPPGADSRSTRPPRRGGEYGADGPEHSDVTRVRSLDQCRADALAAIAWRALRCGHLHDADPVDRDSACQARGDRCGTRLAGRGGRPVRVNVTVPLTALLGLDDAPGELEGYGPIPAQVARRLAVDGTWRRMLTDPVGGALLDYGRTRYAPPQDLADFVRARDRECVMAGCHRPAIGCHLDHTLPYPAGTTSAGNLGPLCERHHLAKHHSGWRVRQLEPGTFVWTSPTGRRHTIRPLRYASGRLSRPDPPA